jgi:hypothetical protein
MTVPLLYLKKRHPHRRGRAGPLSQRRQNVSGRARWTQNNKALHSNVLYFKGCPNHEPAVEQVRKALRSEGLPILVNEVEITDPAMAQKFGFLGSPSIRIDGIDVEPGAREIKSFGFGCRTYSDDEGRRSGLPPVGLIQQAARERRSA